MTFAKHPHAEVLESRRLMAGDVVAFLDGAGNLIVIGDGAANGILVDTFGDFTIAGQDAGGAPTSVNGEPNGVARFPVTGEADVRIILLGGDDVVEVGTRSDSVDAPDDLEIYTGAGDDAVTTIGDTNVGDDLEIHTGTGDDTVRVITTEVADDLDVLTGAGDDAVNVYGSTVGDDLLVVTGDGRDAVGLGFVNVFCSRVFAPVSVAEETLIDLGRDDDTLAVIGSSFAGTFRADGGDGNDGLAAADNAFSRRPRSVRVERNDPAPV